MGPIFQALQYAFPRQQWLARSNIDFGEAFNYAEAGGRDSYWWLRPNQVRTDLSRRRYNMYSSPARKRRYVAVTPSPRRVRRRRGYTRMYAVRRRRTRSWKRAARRTVGARPGTSNCKTTSLVTSGETKQSRQIYKVPLIRVARGTAIDQRLRDIINVRGFRLELAFINLKPRMFILNWAIVHPHAQVLGGQSTGSTFPTLEFFRGYADTRAQQPSDALNGLQWVNAKINTDLFAVLRRGRITLNPGRPNSDSPTATDVVYWPEKGSNFRLKQIYVKLARQVTFEPNISSLEPTEQLFFVYWLDDPFAASGAAGVEAAIGEEARIITYFRETRD